MTTSEIVSRLDKIQATLDLDSFWTLERLNNLFQKLNDNAEAACVEDVIEVTRILKSQEQPAYEYYKSLVA